MSTSLTRFVGVISSSFTLTVNRFLFFHNFIPSSVVTSSSSFVRFIFTAFSSYFITSLLRTSHFTFAIHRHTNAHAHTCIYIYICADCIYVANFDCVAFVVLVLVSNFAIVAVAVDLCNAFVFLNKILNQKKATSLFLAVCDKRFKAFFSTCCILLHLSCSKLQ